MGAYIYDPGIDLQDESLFGNEVAEDATEKEFKSYYYEKKESVRFSGLQERLLVAKAYKGEGKSALLRRTGFRVRDFKENVIIERKGHQISPSLTTEDYGEWIREWKRIILNACAYEIGSTIGFAYNDDSMSLVEEAEKHGFKEKTFLSSVLDRLGISYSANGISIKPEKLGIAEIKQTEKILERWAKKKMLLWIFIDDVDKNFENTARHRIKVASFFDAIRDIHIQLPNVYIRTTIRPNVWTIICREFESLSHVRQYLVDLSWSASDIEQIIFWRIRGFLYRNGNFWKVWENLKGKEDQKCREVISLVFQDPMPWGDSHKPPSQVLTTLSKRRPRWAIELAKTGSMAASQNSHKKVIIDDILSLMDLFGKNRIYDIVAEFKSQCPQIEDLIIMFRQAHEEMDTETLLGYLADRLPRVPNLSITGVIGKPTERDVANFLFEIGFIAGKKYQDGGYEHFTFADRPFFFKSMAVEEDDLWWEIHPCYRQALEIRRADGRHRSLARQPGR